MKCPNCNSDNREDAKFCRNCGAKFLLCSEGLFSSTTINAPNTIIIALEQELIKFPLVQPWGTSIIDNPEAIKDGNTYTLYDELMDIELFQIINNKTFDLLIGQYDSSLSHMPIASQIIDFSRSLKQWQSYFKLLGLEMRDYTMKERTSNGVLLSGNMCFGSSLSPISFTLTFDEILEDQTEAVSCCYIINNRINRLF